MQSGRIVADGDPHDILTDEALLASARLEPPTLTKVFAELSRAQGGVSSDIPITVAEAKALLRRWQSR